MVNLVNYNDHYGLVGILKDCNTGSMNLLQKQIFNSDGDNIFYFDNPEKGRVQINDILEFIKHYSPLNREVRCAFGCPQRKDCYTRTQSKWGIDRSFSIGYVLENFEDNENVGTPITSLESLVYNKIELYITSRIGHIEEHESIWGKKADDPEKDMMLTQKEILDHYTPVFKKIVEIMVSGEMKEYLEKTDRNKLSEFIETYNSTHKSPIPNPYRDQITKSA